MIIAPTRGQDLKGFVNLLGLIQICANLRENLRKSAGNFLRTPESRESDVSKIGSDSHGPRGEAINRVYVIGKDYA